MKKGLLLGLAACCISGKVAFAQIPTTSRPSGAPSASRMLSDPGDGASAGRLPNVVPDASGIIPNRDVGQLDDKTTFLQACEQGCPESCCTVCGPAGRFWVSAEYLQWWTKDMQVPPLVTTGSPLDAVPGALGQPGTRVLLGDSLDGGTRSGARFTGGLWLNDCHTKGVEASYFFLGSRTNGFFTGASGSPDSQVITRPFLNIPPTGAAPFQDAQIVAFPGTAGGTVSVQNSSRLQGASTNGICNLYCCDSGCNGNRIDFVAGGSWIQLNEGLSVVEDIDPSPTVGGGNIGVLDQFGTRNNFYGGQIGLREEIRRGRFFVNARGMIALGNTHQEVDINGGTSFTPPGGGMTTVLPGGLLAQQSNIGNYSRDRFTYIPQLDFNVGYQVTDHTRLFVGYTVLYWSNVVRPGDAIDVAVNPSQIPSNTGPGALTGSAQPAFKFRDSDFWAQGVNFGLEVRY